MEFGLPVCSLDSPLGAKGILMFLIHINWADLPSNNETCKHHEVTVEVELNRPVSISSQLGVNSHVIKHGCQKGDSSSASPQRCD